MLYNAEQILNTQFEAIRAYLLDAVLSHLTPVTGSFPEWDDLIDKFEQDVRDLKRSGSLP